MAHRKTQTGLPLEMPGSRPWCQMLRAPPAEVDVPHRGESSNLYKWLPVCYLCWSCAASGWPGMINNKIDEKDFHFQHCCLKKKVRSRLNLSSWELRMHIVLQAIPNPVRNVKPPIWLFKMVAKRPLLQNDELNAHIFHWTRSTSSFQLTCGL